MIAKILVVVSWGNEDIEPKGLVTKNDIHIIIPVLSLSYMLTHFKNVVASICVGVTATAILLANHAVLGMLTRFVDDECITKIFSTSTLVHKSCVMRMILLSEGLV